MGDAPEATHKFQAEVSQVLHLVIHSLYSHKEIFLRELVSNASDALDKLRFRALTEPGLLEGGPELEIRIVPDEAAGTLTLEDSGVGMTRDELVTHLGTIAHSGSRAFLAMLQQQGKDKDVTLIGQFGVGFYSAYLVADRVEVVSHAAGSEEAWRWESEAKDTFTVVPAERATRGTSVILHLRKEHEEFLTPWRLRELVRRYSDFVSHPIRLRGKDKDGKEEDETINRASALWQRSKSEITAEQYEELYKHLTHDAAAPLAHTHFQIEGNQQFAGLLYLPRAEDRDLFADDRKKGIRLFVKRVFIMEDCEQLLPPWLRFVRGVIDSDDLPLNVSREMLQDSAAVRAIKRQVVKKVLDLLDEVAKERPADYAEFFRAHGATIKSGLATDFEHREKIGALVRFASSHTVDHSDTEKGDENGGLTSLEAYVGRMKENQPAIYYVTGESLKAIAGSPHLEALRQRGYEVLYLTDPVDEWAVDGLREFSGKKLVSAMRAELPLEESEDDKQEREKAKGDLGPLLSAMHEILKDHVKEVRVSDRLTDSPACLVGVEAGTNPYLERVLKERGHAVPRQQRILEVNAKHPLLVKMAALHAREAASAEVIDWTETLYDQALLTEGSAIEDPQRFAKRVAELLTLAAAQKA